MAKSSGLLLWLCIIGRKGLLLRGCRSKGVMNPFTSFLSMVSKTSSRRISRRMMRGNYVRCSFVQFPRRKKPAELADVKEQLIAELNSK